MSPRNYHEDDGGGYSGSVTTKDEAMGIVGGKRVNNMHRDDVRNHIIACETYGYLNGKESFARQDAADKARTEGELFHVVRDLPDEAGLAALGARKRLARLAVGGKATRLFKWLLATRLGRTVLHGGIGVAALMLAIIPVTVIDNATHGHFYPFGVTVTVLTMAVGIIAFVANLFWCIDWFIDNG